MEYILAPLAADIGLSVRSLKLMQKIAAHDDDRYPLEQLAPEEGGPLHMLTTYGALALVYGQGIMNAPTEVRVTTLGLLVAQSIGLATTLAEQRRSMDEQRGVPVLFPSISDEEAAELEIALGKKLEKPGPLVWMPPVPESFGTYSVSSEKGKFWLVLTKPDLTTEQRMSFPTRKLAETVADELNKVLR